MLIHLVTRRVAPALLLVALATNEAWAQFDFVGSWAPLATEDVQNDSVPVDYLGLALTEEVAERMALATLAGGGLLTPETLGRCA